MTRGRLAAEEAMRVRIDRDTAAGRDAGTIGIVQARIERTPGGLGGNAELDRMGRIQRPRMPLVEFREEGRHAFGIGKTAAGVFLGVAGDRAGLFDRGRDRFGAHVGGAGRTLAFAEVDADRDTPIARVFDSLDLTHAHVDVEAGVEIQAHFCLRGAKLAATCEHVGRQVGEFVERTFRRGRLGEFSAHGLSLDH